MEKIKVLIVDDMEVNLDLLEARLEGSGYEVTTAGNGIEALEILKTDSFDMIISDILMPKMDGYQLCRECKKDDTLRKIPFVFYTATYTDKKDEQFALSLGADQFIVKPMESNSFMEIIEDIFKNYKKGLLTPSEIPVEEEDIYLKEYNERLINKLEKKMLDLESEITKRKQTEEALRETSGYLENLLTYANASITVWDPEGRITRFNHAFERLTGYKAEEVIGQELRILFPEESRDESLSKIERTLSGEYWESVEIQILRKDGDTRIVLWNTANIYAKDGTTVLATIAQGADITDRKRAEERVEHLNNVLRAIRGVNQLIVKEKKLDRLIKGACGNIIETRGYYSAWIALLDESGGIVETAEAGFGKDFLPVIKQLKRGEMPDCARKALSQSDVVVTKDPVSTCVDCLLSAQLGDRGAMTVQLEHEGKVYGLFCVSMPRDFLEDEEEQSLFKEVAGDIAFASHGIELAEERKQAEEALRESEEKFRELFDSSNDAIFVANPETRKLVDCNKQAQKLTGYSRKEILSMRADQLHPKDKVKKIMEGFKKHVAGELLLVESEVLTKDKKRVPVSISSSLVEIAGEKYLQDIFRDITERKQAEEERVRLATAIDQAAETVVITDTNGTIHYANPAFERITGYTQKEAIGKNPRILQSGKHNKEFYRKMWDRLTRGEVWTGRFINKKKDDTLYEEEATISPILDASGKITNYVAVKRDVTEEVKLETKLRQAQKMEAIGTLAGGIAHDFNNILSLIMGYTELAMHNVSEDSRVRDNMDKVFKASERARDLVKQILAFSRQGGEEIKPAQIHLIVKEILKLLRPTLPTTIEIRQNITSTGTVMADPTQIHQVIMNLCTNAYHAMSDKGGILEVSLTDVELDSDYTAKHLDAHPGPYLKLTVSDTGHGMEKKVLNRIFDPYYTTKEKTGGTGMGLAVVHGIVKSHGGVISVYSEPGKGSTFNVFLPRTESAEGVVEPEEIIPLPIGKERILFIDDEPAIVDIGKGMLEHLGYTVVTRTSPIEALEAFKAMPDKFDLVITDMTMPKMTGDELAKELMKIRLDIPIILCTGFSELINEEKAKAMGIRAFVMKPVVQRELANAVRKALDS